MLRIQSKHEVKDSQYFCNFQVHVLDKDSGLFPCQGSDSEGIFSWYNMGIYKKIQEYKNYEWRIKNVLREGAYLSQLIWSCPQPHGTLLCFHYLLLFQELCAHERSNTWQDRLTLTGAGMQDPQALPLILHSKCAGRTGKTKGSVKTFWPFQNCSAHETTDCIKRPRPHFQGEIQIPPKVFLASWVRHISRNVQTRCVSIGAIS